MERERDLYPKVAEWARRSLGCFDTGIDRGLRLGRVDVVGLRDSGGRLSGRSEVISIEVKKGTQPFATSIGQAHGYSIYADRCYLAEMRSKPFSADERSIAAHLGVGLISITGSKRTRITEVVTSPLSTPLEGLRLELIEKLGYSLCTICNSLFQRGDRSRFDAYVQRHLDSGRSRNRAVESEKGYMYWLSEVGNRSGTGGDQTFHRRYLCSDCVPVVFGNPSVTEA
jgi:hypothetical protein